MAVTLFRKSRTITTDIAHLPAEVGDVCLQEIPSVDFVIHYYQAAIFRPVVFKSRYQSNHPVLRIMLKSDMIMEDGLGEFNELRESQVSLMTEENESIHLKTLGFYSWIDIHCPMHVVAEILPMFHLNDHHELRFECNVNRVPRRANPELLQAVHCMLYCSYSDELRAYYCNLRAKDILLQYFVIEQESEQNVGDEMLPPSRAEVDSVNIAERMISAELSKHFFIPQLARKVNMNECRFKTVFKELYGTGPFEYRQRKRLEWGRHLLDEQGMSVKAVAMEIGYRTSSFVNIFREHYGYTPGLFQKSRRKKNT
jgi:AraC-like DNA-binding protein